MLRTSTGINHRVATVRLATPIPTRRLIPFALYFTLVSTIGPNGMHDIGIPPLTAFSSSRRQLLYYHRLHRRDLGTALHVHSNGCNVPEASDQPVRLDRERHLQDISNNVTFYRPTWSVANTFGANSALTKDTAEFPRAEWRNADDRIHGQPVLPDWSGHEQRDAGDAAIGRAVLQSHARPDPG